MDKNYVRYVEQLKNRPFRKMLFTIYNYIVEEGYIRNLIHQGIDGDIDELECLIFDLSDDERNNIKKGKTSKYYSFKKYIEEEIQNNKVRMGIFVMKEYGALIAVKPINYTLKIDN